MDRTSIVMDVRHPDDADLLRRMLRERVALSFSEKRRWFAGSTFTITGHPLTLENFQRDANAALEIAMIDRQW